MSLRTPVIAVFDIGKTNKKVFLWNNAFEIVFEKQQSFAEIVDEVGFACEDLATLQQWIISTFTEICQMPEFELVGLNFSAYGASFVYVDRMGEPVAPLYNYLKPVSGPFPYADFGGEAEFARKTASPILGNLNSGLQVYAARLKPFWPEVFKAFHFPNYLASLFTGKFLSEITSIGCHTALWDFDLGQYHPWVSVIEAKLPENESPDIQTVRERIFQEFDGRVFRDKVVPNPPERGTFGYAYIRLKEGAVPQRQKPFLCMWNVKKPTKKWSRAWPADQSPSAPSTSATTSSPRWPPRRRTAPAPSS